MITASSVKHMSAEKSVGESITEAKARKYGMLNITSFYVSGDAVFFFFNRINVLIAPVRSQDHAPYWLC